MSKLFRFGTEVEPDATIHVSVDGHHIRRHILALRPEHKHRTTPSCGPINESDIQAGRFLIVDEAEDGQLVDYIVDPAQGQRLLGRLRPAVCVVIELMLDGKPEDVSAIVNGVLDAGDFQDAIRDYAANAGCLVRVRSALVTQQKRLMVRKDS
jgi:hypothetical protein